VVSRVTQLKKKIQLPFLLENPSYYVKMPGAEMPERNFFTGARRRRLRHVVRREQCLCEQQKPRLRSESVYSGPYRSTAWDRSTWRATLTVETSSSTHEGPIIDPVWDLYQFTIEAIGRR